MNSVKKGSFWCHLAAADSFVTQEAKGATV